MPLLRVGLVALIGFLFSLTTTAETLHPFVSAGIGRDDNLFRLSDEQLRQTNDGADTYRSVIGGLRFERPVGRQLFSGHADFSSMKFDRYSQLDYVGKDLSGQWHWFLAAHFEGHMGGSYEKVLAPFADFHSDQRNLRITRRQFVDGSWRFHPAWRWVGSYNKSRYVYDLDAQRGNDRTEDNVTSGVDYLAASGSTLGFQLRRLRGSYPSVQSPVAETSGRGYVQDEAKINVVWLATGRTQLLFLGGWVRRRQADRVDSGTNARLIVNWTPAGRLKLTGQGWREFSAIDGTLIDSALASGASAEGSWDISEKVQAVASLKRESREFTPYSGARASLTPALSSDSTSTNSVGLIYRPLRSMMVKLTAYRDRRSGSVAAGTNSYVANGIAFAITQQF